MEHFLELFVTVVLKVGLKCSIELLLLLKALT